MPADLPDEIERLSQSATAGPWCVSQKFYIGSERHNKGAFAEMKSAFTLPPDSPEHAANAALIVYLRNHVSEIAEAIRKANDYQFIPDSQGGHIVAHGKVWRPTEEKP